MKPNLLRLVSLFVIATSATAAPVHFATNDPDKRLAIVSNPPSANLVENEVGDDFVLNATTNLTHATFTGLIPDPQSGPPYTVDQVVIEIYRVYPLDSGPPSGNVGIPTRSNSPSDNAFAVRDSAVATLHYTQATLDPAFTANASIVNDLRVGAGTVPGILGAETQFDVTFDQPIVLPAGHYFFVPQVALNSNHFYWLSTQKPIVAPGTPITNGTDIQLWTRNNTITPDWLRVGADIVGGGASAPTFNGAFSLDGEDDVVFATNPPDGKMAAVSFPFNANSGMENEVGDDFVLSTTTRLTNATFTGLIPNDVPIPTINQVVVEIYRVFPLDSGPLSANVGPGGSIPTRANSPADNAFAIRDSAVADLNYTTTALSATPFIATDSVVNNILTGAGSAGSISGTETQFNITFDQPIVLPAGHYFFVPQVALSNNNFYWLSAPKPIVAPGTPIVGATDIQLWMRNNSIAPDWLRLGTDIIGTGIGGAPAPTFNGAFSLEGESSSTFHFATNDSDNSLAMATGTATDVETADDFVLTVPTVVTHATFTGLLTGTTPTVGAVSVEVYRKFPDDSAPFSGNVPSRTNSPSDNVFDARTSAAPSLRFSENVVNPAITAANSVAATIAKNIGATAAGEGPLTGQEVQFDVTFDPPFSLQAGQYFFVPSVEVANGTFYWLSSPKPITAPGTPIPAPAADLQTWIRNSALAPDWLRVGTDIIGGPVPPPTYNATFSLDGDSDDIFGNGFE